MPSAQETMAMSFGCIMQVSCQKRDVLSGWHSLCGWGWRDLSEILVGLVTDPAPRTPTPMGVAYFLLFGPMSVSICIAFRN